MSTPTPNGFSLCVSPCPTETNSDLWKMMSRRGFRTRFANGYTISVQFGTHNYCSCRDTLRPLSSIQSDAYNSWNDGSSEDAEVAIIDADGEFVEFQSNGDTVRGYTSPDDLANIIAWVVALAPKQKKVSV